MVNLSKDVTFVRGSIVDKALTDLIKISKTVGDDLSLVLGNFGNTSVKTADGKFMYIKTSGTAIKDISARSGWRKIKPDALKPILQDSSLERSNRQRRQSKIDVILQNGCADSLSTKPAPSIESCFHSILDRYVIHLHAVSVLPYVCTKDGKNTVRQIFKKQGYPPLWIPYASPGYLLAKKIRKLNADYKKRYSRTAAVIFLQNHGLIITAQSYSPAMKLLKKTVNTCSGELNRAKTKSAARRYFTPNAKTISQTTFAIRQALFDTTAKNFNVRHFLDEKIAGFMVQENASELCSIPAVTPDELIYCHGPAMWLENSDPETVLSKLNTHIAKYRLLPVAFLIKPVGLFITGNKKQALLRKEIAVAYFSIRSRAAKLGTIKPLTGSQRDILLNIEG